MLMQMLPCPTEGAATGGFALVKHGGDLGKLVIEDLAQQKDRALKRLELLQQDQEGQRDRLLRLHTLFGISLFRHFSGEDRLRQPGTHIHLSLPASKL